MHRFAAIYYSFFSVVGMTLFLSCSSEPDGIRDTRSDTWVAVDDLAREVPGFDKVGKPRNEKTVGLFYYMWLNEDEHLHIHDIERIRAGEKDWGQPGSFHFSTEPLYGYYSSQDKFVIRKHMQMIADAGIDFIFFDVTNRLTYEKTYKTILSVIEQMSLEGYRVPAVAFLANSRMDETIEALYDELYGQGLYSDFWFMWEGKPLLMGKYTGENPIIRDFFTYKRSWAFTNGSWFTETEGEDRWAWLDHYPQQPGLKNGAPEYINVAAAHHPVGRYAIGKSTGANRQDPPVYSNEGTYFGIQWERAHEVDPPVIGITQWNEYLAQRFVFPEPRHHVDYMVRRPLKPGDSFFIDSYSPEYSRDIEPLRGHYRDNMYLQMFGHIRRFKGARPGLASENPRRIEINDDFRQWRRVGPSFYDDLHDANHRYHVSYGSELVYTNTTGRNDLDEMKVSFDSENIYFYVKTKMPLTHHTDSRWMQLLINTDANYHTGWYGYDFIVNHTVISANETTIKAFTNAEQQWHNPRTVRYYYEGNEMHIEIPADLLGINTGRPFHFDFKWVDNSLANNDIMDLYVDGDTAPNGRFNYRYIHK